MFWGHKSTHCRRKNKKWEKSDTLKKSIQCPVENKNKRFNDRVKVILSRKKTDEGEEMEICKCKINDVNIKLQLDTGSDIYLLSF